ncbi:MAG: replicative DNA helicase [Cetobacterium sp.]
MRIEKKIIYGVKMSKIIVNDTELEAYVLGRAIDSIEDRSEIMALLTTKDFYDIDNNLIAKGLYKAENESLQADFLSIHSAIKTIDIEHYNNKNIGKRLSEIIKPKEHLEIKNIKQAIIKIKNYSLMRMLSTYLKKKSDLIANFDYDINKEVNIIIEDMLELLQKKTHQQTKHIKDASTEIKNRLQYGDARMIIKSNYEELDKKIEGFKEGNLIVFAGRSGMGKTALIVDIADSIAIKNIPVMIFSLEMNDDELTERLLANKTGIKFHKIQNTKYCTDKEKALLINYLQNIEKLPIFINDQPIINIDEIALEIRRCVIKNGIKAVILDHLQIIQTDNKNQRHRELDTLTSRLKALSKELKIPIILLSQLSREVEKRKDNRPILSDLRESGGIEQNADLVIGIYRDQYYNKDADLTYELILLKNRNGVIGTVKIYFDPSTMRFSNYPNFENHQKDHKTIFIAHDEFEF